METYNTIFKLEELISAITKSTDCGWSRWDPLSDAKASPRYYLGNSA